MSVRRIGGKLHSYRGRRILSIEEGRREQQSGIDFFNGMLSVNLLKDGEVINIRYDFHPEKRFIEESWLAETLRCPI